MSQGPLAGIHVLDFMWLAAGPFATACLADFGADVIKVESRHAIDLFRVNPPYKDGVPGYDRSYEMAVSASSKKSLSVDIGTQEGREVIRRLVPWADVITENFGSDVLDRHGLGYTDLAKLKPDVIVVSSNTFGRNGPYSNFAGVGCHPPALAGFNNLVGWPDRPPVISHAAYGDVTTPWFTALAILAALEYRRRTGKGQFIEVTHLESVLSFFPVDLLDTLVNGGEHCRKGNTDEHAAPHGCYPCRGEDRWCVIAVFSDFEWEAFCRVIGSPPWTKSSKFSTFEQRKNNEDEMDRLIMEWTLSQKAEDVMYTMQEAGVAAGVVNNGEDLVDNDPQLKHRGSFPRVSHPVLGSALHYGWPEKLSRTPYQMKPSPCLGEHNATICLDILGMSEEELIALLERKILE